MVADIVIPHVWEKAMINSACSDRHVCGEIWEAHLRECTEEVLERERGGKAWHRDRRQDREDRCRPLQFAVQGE